LCEATYARESAGAADMHMWAEQAGGTAAAAGVARLVLVHIWPTIDPGVSEREAAARFDGPIEAAVEGAVYEL
jgi:ribonuclease BN (tRNA processing enzyme)